MKKTLMMLSIALATLSYSACSNRNSSEETTDNADSLAAERTADSLLQEELNAGNPPGSIDSVDTIGEETTAPQ